MAITLSIIGGGNMANAIVQGALKSQILLPEQIAIAEPNEQSRKVFVDLGCFGFNSVEELPKSEHILLAIKPQVFSEIATDIKDGVIYSIMAGITTSQITTLTSLNRVVRIMPNLPCKFGLGATALTRTSQTALEDAKLAYELFNSIGVVIDVEEQIFDAVTAVSGSGPAYVFLLAEAMIKGGMDSGLPFEVSDALVRQTILGAATMLANDKQSPELLRDAVTSRGGTTAAAIESMQDAAVVASIVKGIVAARNRGAELSQD